jgi:hypothetical protein
MSNIVANSYIFYRNNLRGWKLHCLGFICDMKAHINHKKSGINIIYLALIIKVLMKITLVKHFEIYNFEWKIRIPLKKNHQPSNILILS